MRRVREETLIQPLIQFLSLTHIADRYEGTGVVTNSVECPPLTKEKDFAGGDEGREI